MEDENCTALDIFKPRVEAINCSDLYVRAMALKRDLESMRDRVPTSFQNKLGSALYQLENVMDYIASSKMILENAD